MASWHLVDILFAMGFGVSYSEARQYEASVMIQNQPSMHQDSIMQFMFDNTDFNVCTLDGYVNKTIMGMILFSKLKNPVILYSPTIAVTKMTLIYKTMASLILMFIHTKLQPSIPLIRRKLKGCGRGNTTQTK